MRIGETAASIATPGKESRSPANGQAKGRSLVPLEPVQRRARPHGHRFHHSSAFVAHLSLQFDDIDARRLARSERLDAAISSYDQGADKAQFPEYGSRISLRV